MRQLPLVKGGFTLVDDDVYEWASRFAWRKSTKGYVIRSTGSGWNGTYRTIYLAREIVNPRSGQQVDHRRRTKLDNRRSNLRPCAPVNNMRNVGLRRDNKSGAKGVYWHKRIGKWCASIQVNRKRLNLGYFPKLAKAVAVYNAAAKKHFGEFAFINGKPIG